jgi:hypothetical protein
MLKDSAGICGDAQPLIDDRRGIHARARYSATPTPVLFHSWRPEVNDVARPIRAPSRDAGSHFPVGR